MQSVVAENVSTQDGGGLFNLGGEATIIQSAFVADSACRGGGVYDDRFDATRVSVVDSTLSGNEASINGGGISSIHGAETSGRSLHLHGDQAHGNVNPPPVALGGGSYTESAVELFASIITASTGDDCAVDGIGSFAGASNLVDDHATGPCSPISFASVTALDATLSATRTHDLQAGSNAIDGASLCVDSAGGKPVTEDQRGEPRDDGLCDAGAYELQ